MTHEDVIDESGNSLEVSDFSSTKIDYAVVKAGDLNPTQHTKSFENRMIVDGIVYGLVNVRTDGNRILCAVLNEKKSKWEYQSFESRF